MSSPLSEKAKGKQRAEDPSPVSIPETPPLKDLTVRFTEGIPDLTVEVAEQDTVKDVKNNVCVIYLLRVCVAMRRCPTDPPCTARIAQ